MTDAEIVQIEHEIEDDLLGRKFGKVFPISDTSFAIDFYPHSGSYLFVDFSPRSKSAFLIVRKLKDLERSQVHSSNFVIQLRKLLTGRELTHVTIEEGILGLRLVDSEGDVRRFLIQLAGNTPNTFVIDADGQIIDAARSSNLAGQKVGDIYSFSPTNTAPEPELRDLNGGSLSKLLDDERRSIDAGAKFATLARDAQKKIKNEIGKRRKLVANLQNDLTNHGNAEDWKRFGDLILANISILSREGDTFRVTDYFDPEQNEILIPADTNKSPTEAAEVYFRKYTKARNAVSAIAKRSEIVTAEIVLLERKKDEIETAIDESDEQMLSRFVQKKEPETQVSNEKKKVNEFSGARRFVSTDGFEILVGKKAKDNDHLTFRIAKATDMWLHAADYPGSHVVVRNPNRKEIPNQTLLEGARLAAFFSDAREKPKAAVNYTPKKFVNKPKRSVPGLASLSSFKTILVEPGFPDGVGKAD